MPYEIEVGQKADRQLGELDAAIGASIERKILWLGQNAASIIHRRLVGMPDFVNCASVITGFFMGLPRKETSSRLSDPASFRSLSRFLKTKVN